MLFHGYICMKRASATDEFSPWQRHMWINALTSSLAAAGPQPSTSCTYVRDHHTSLVGYTYSCFQMRALWTLTGDFSVCTTPTSVCFFAIKLWINFASLAALESALASLQHSPQPESHIKARQLTVTGAVSPCATLTTRVESYFDAPLDVCYEQVSAFIQTRRNTFIFINIQIQIFPPYVTFQVDNMASLQNATVMPARGRMDASSVTMCFRLPPGKDVVAVLNMCPRYMRVHEYPYDIERGVAIPGPQLVITPPTSDTKPSRMFLDTLHYRVPWPDASMSSNVVCITVTVLLLLFISMLRILVQPLSRT